jgi:hypothetical protein
MDAPAGRGHAAGPGARRYFTIVRQTGMEKLFTLDFIKVLVV